MLSLSTALQIMLSLSTSAHTPILSHITPRRIPSTHLPLRYALAVPTIEALQFPILMLHSEIIAVCSQIHAKHINTLCGQNVEFVNVRAAGVYSSVYLNF